MAPTIKLGITVRRGKQSVWSVGIDRQFYENLPLSQRRVQIFTGSDKMMLKFGEKGAKPYFKRENVGEILWVQLSGAHSNMLPTPQTRHRAVITKGVVETDAYIFDTPDFIRYETLVKSSGMQWLHQKIDEQEAKVPVVQPPVVPTLAAHPAEPLFETTAVVHRKARVKGERRRRQPPRRWLDAEVHRLLERLRACLLACPEVTIVINEDRSVSASRTVSL